jgi:iron complex transport system permease protein
VFIRVIKNHPFLPVLILLPFIFWACLCFGNIFISPLQVLSSFSEEKSTLNFIVKLRVFRLFTGFIVGGALAVAGLGYQAVIRNPLAEPYILGISGGASLGAAIAIATGLSMLSVLAIPALSFCGAIITLILVLLMARGAGAEYTNNVLLSGVIVGTVFSSILMFIISVVGLQQLNSITWWMLGNLQPGNRKLLLTVAIIVFTCTVILFLMGREVNVISLGEEMAYYLGLSPFKVMMLVLGISSLLAASAVTLSGIIGFVGLIVPHVLRQLYGSDHRRLFPLALLGGGLFLMICDTVAKTVLAAQGGLPVGVITAFVGGPFFLWLLNRKRKRAL